MHGSNAVVVHHSIDVIADACIERALNRIGALESDLSWPTVRLAHGETRIASSAASGLGWQTIATRDIDEFKGWVGADDLDVRTERRAPVTCGAVNHTPSSAILRARSLDEAQQEELSRAFIHYVYGDSSTVSGWRPVIERHRDTFAADVVTAEKIVIPAKATLALTGRPIMFAANTVELRGGTLMATVDGHYAIGNVISSAPTTRRAL